MSERLKNFLNCYRPTVEQALEKNLPLSREPHAGLLNQALRYALFPGGKRIRPFLTILGTQIANGSASDVSMAAIAMEYLHTSSIILDDLPSMDDAPLRRGRKSLHLVFGESVALLTALTLLNESFALLARNARGLGNATAAGELIEKAACLIGSNGMIGGQMVDLCLQGVNYGNADQGSRNLKTTALMRLTMIAGAAALGTGEEDLAALGDFGDALGTAYQICDDLLDEFADPSQIGKPCKQDLRHDRTTYVAALGGARAHALAIEILEDAEQRLRERFCDRKEIDILMDASGMILHAANPAAIAAA
jgi:geranylgeranyl diphosphate synthase type II